MEKIVMMMIPGFRPTGRIHPRKLKQMMRQFGISVEELENVNEVVIKTDSKTYVFDKDVSVTVMNVQGQKTYQIVGVPRVLPTTATTTITREEKAEEEKAIVIPEADVKLVAEQAGVSEAVARKALEECDGNPAEAIIKLTTTTATTTGDK